MLFNKEHFGKRISDELSQILRKNTNQYDRMECATANDISESSLRQIVYRMHSLSYNNHQAVIDLMRKALSNIRENKHLLDQSEDFLLEELEKGPKETVEL